MSQNDLYLPLESTLAKTGGTTRCEACFLVVHGVQVTLKHYLDFSSDEHDAKRLSAAKLACLISPAPMRAAPHLLVVIDLDRQGLAALLGTIFRLFQRSFHRGRQASFAGCLHLSALLKNNPQVAPCRVRWSLRSYSCSCPKKLPRLG